MKAQRSPVQPDTVITTENIFILLLYSFRGEQIENMPRQS